MEMNGLNNSRGKNMFSLGKRGYYLISDKSKIPADKKR